MAVTRAAVNDGSLYQAASDAFALPCLHHRHTLDLEHTGIVGLENLEMANDQVFLSRRNFAAAMPTT